MLRLKQTNINLKQGDLQAADTDSRITPLSKGLSFLLDDINALSTDIKKIPTSFSPNVDFRLNLLSTVKPLGFETIYYSLSKSKDVNMF